MLKQIKFLVILVCWLNLAHAAPPFNFRPPPFMGGMPGRVQMQAIFQNRHQNNTLLYQKAIEELRNDFGSAQALSDAHNNYTESLMECYSAVISESEESVKENK